MLHRIFLIPFGRIYEHAQIEPYLRVGGLIIFLWMTAFFLVGLYRPVAGLVHELDEFLRVVKGVSLAIMEIMVVSFLYRGIPESRYVLLYAWGLGIIVFTISRIVILHIEILLIRKGVGVENALIIGGGMYGQDIAEKLILYPTIRLNYVGTLDDKPPESIHYHLRDRFRLLGSIDQYRKVCEAHRIKVLFLTKRDFAHKFVMDLIDHCEKHGIAVKILSDMVFLSPLTMTDALDGLPLLSTTQNIKGQSALLKRVLDIVGSIVALLVFSPLMVAVAIGIKLVSPEGPVLYKQERVGKDDKTFLIMKFRSMVPDAETVSGPTMVQEKGETRYHRLGHFLRRWSLDELPQLFNVLRGEMSLVGPRPERPHFVEKFSRTIPYYRYRHKAKGGITGWAQVNGRSVLTHRPEHKVKYDIYYIKNWSLMLDIKILLKTFWTVLKKEESY